MPLNVDKLSTGSLVVNGSEINNGTAHYELDITQTNVVTVNTTKGIIDIIGMGTDPGLTPDYSFGSTTEFYINNPKLILTEFNRDNIYIQYSVYYKPGVKDAVVPYVISTGILPSDGVKFRLYNAGSDPCPPPPTPCAVQNPWTGALYVYYELYTIN
jgi:hypothetical protein